MFRSPNFARSLIAATALGLAVFAAACGGNPANPTGHPSLDGDSDGGGDGSTTPTPTVVAVSPTIWHAGDTVKVLGNSFIPDSAGTIVVRFGGTYTGTDGSDQDVDMSVTATYHASNSATFIFEADNAPAGFGASPGTFVGKYKVTNVGNDGSEAASATTDTQITVGPSILVWKLEPISESCAAPRVTDSLNGNQLEMDLEVTGLDAGSAGAPIGVEIAWVDAAGETRDQQASISNGTTTSVTVDPGTIADGDFPVDGSGATLFVPVGFSITAADGSGHTLQRRITVNIREDYSVEYDGNSHIVKVFDPEPVTQCLPGGQTGTSFNYSEGTSEGRSRGYSLSGNFGVSVWILSLGFGFGVSSSVSSGTSTGLGVSHSVFPHWYGAFYRQTAQLEKDRADLSLRLMRCANAHRLGLRHRLDLGAGLQPREDRLPAVASTLDGERRHARGWKLNAYPRSASVVCFSGLVRWPRTTEHH